MKIEGAFFVWLLCVLALLLLWPLVLFVAIWIAIDNWIFVLKERKK